MDALKQGMTTNTKLFDKVKSDDPEIIETPFGKNIEEFFQEIDPQVNEAVETMSQLQSEFEQVCDYFMLDKSDERRQ